MNDFERWWDKYTSNVQPIEDMLRATLEEVWDYKQAEIEELESLALAVVEAHNRSLRLEIYRSTIWLDDAIDALAEAIGCWGNPRPSAA